MFLKDVLDQTWATIVTGSLILAGIYLIFLKKVLDQTWRFLKTEKIRVWRASRIFDFVDEFFPQQIQRHFEKVVLT